ncbi:MAG: hypothetical protein EOM91_17040 [Sphingobacteriia bacterium]|nr:hypothetical protein [Sphingobacteriia bacterium]NCC41052.1 hypothetical protein [Gammaproteobacteria bacterium]
MTERVIRETFFRPDPPVERTQTTIPAALYNGLRLLLKYTRREAVFLPIRSMQYQAVVDRTEVIFIDSHGGYAHQDGEGGRLIRIAWRPRAARSSLTEPVQCEIVYYLVPERKPLYSCRTMG